MYSQPQAYFSNKLIRLPKVIEITGKSRTRIYEDIKKNAFPKQVKTGMRSVAWIEKEIDDWIENQKNQRY
ncbi:helix-turn-helix transcriptional regulator [Yersinia ruckeri]|uniref:helix-turn-helix transcriptional regulator n=1 Tax=Yersinia ruckeri TaxID=29486 RepID=UPI0022375E11|nr:AlpA family transcriptional regulator [Yersinia ruckeri]MCW6542986.1 AlpA family transcriptional regulator [Yersinia ruckeri]MCW6591432.1 AlpA family transcriptional regulator [Yersinia ruckeri]UZX90861.1 AlpA family transcriptional regulator [Yersinia ruckeri]